MALFRVLAMLVLVGVFAGLAHGQTPRADLTFTTVDPPRGDGAQTYMKGTSAQHEATYATDIEGGRLTPESRAPRAVARPSIQPGPAIDGNLALLLVVGFVGLGLFLWLRYGGADLLSRGPRDAPAPRAVAPEAWKIDADRNLSPEALLASIAAMTDRRAAMVRLLRHCLLHAAQVSGTRFARSDTERSALRRLPVVWQDKRLRDLLTRAELAHYGGQDVPEDRFADSLALASLILGHKGQAHV
jgi:hypothetical protein